MPAEKPRIELLRSFALIVAGEPVHVGRAQVRSLLSVLAATPGDVVPSDRIIDHLWPRELPADPGAALRLVVFRTRAALGDAAPSLQQRGGGVSLDADVDAAEFVELVRRCRHEADGVARCRMLEAALELWGRSPALASEDRSPLAELWSRLDSARFEAVTELTSEYVALGRFSEAVALARPELVEHAGEEALAVDVGRALVSLGRKSDAIGVLTATRSHLRDQGLTPTATFSRFEHEVISGTVDIATASPSERTRSDPVGRLVGREREIEALRDVPAGGTVVVLGAAGIGKSALVDGVARAAHESGSVVAIGRQRVDAARPGTAIASLFDSLAASGAPALTDDDRRASARFLTHETSPTAVADASDRDEQERSAAALLAEQATACGAMVVIEDLHDLDRSSRRVIAHLVALQRARVLVTSRVDVDWLPETESIERLVLEPLTKVEVARLAADLLGRPCGDREIDVLHAMTDGHPLFVELVLELQLEGADLDPPPPSIMLAVQQRLGLVSLRAQRTIVTLSAFGTEVPEAQARELVGTFDDDRDEIVSSGLFRVAEGVLTFRHELVATCSYEMLTTSDRIALHDDIGHLLERDGASARAVARHCRAAASVDPRRAYDRCMAAARECGVAFEWEEASDFVDAAAGYVDDAHDTPRRLARLRLNALSGYHLGRSDMVEPLLEWFELARTNGLVDEAAQAVVLMGSAGPALRTGIPLESAAEALDWALGQELAERRRIELLGNAALLFARSELHDRGCRYYLEAYRSIRSSWAEDLGLVETVLARGVAHFSRPVDSAVRSELLDWLRDIAGDDRELVATSAYGAFIHSVEIGNRAMLDDAFDRFRICCGGETVQLRHQPANMTAERELALMTANRLIAIGEGEAAEAAIAEAVDVGLRLSESSLTVDSAQVAFGASTQLASLRFRQGRIGELAGMVGGLTPEALSTPVIQAMVTSVWHGAGELDRAAAALSALADDGFGRLPPDDLWLGALCVVAPPAADLGDRATVDRLIELLEPFGHLGSLVGPVGDALETLARSRGDDDAAAHHRADARRWRQGLGLIES